METVTIKERCILCLSTHNTHLDLNMYQLRGNICTKCTGPIKTLTSPNKKRSEEISISIHLRKKYNIEHYGTNNRSRTITIPLPAFIRDIYRKNEEKKKELVKVSVEEAKNRKTGADLYSTYGDDYGDDVIINDEFISKDDESI